MSRDPPLEVILAKPRGFCAGVVRAISAVESALALHGPPVYVLHEIVHNGHVLAGLRARGVVFTEDLETIPSGACTIFSAHGVGARVRHRARERGLRVVDATCPLVTKVHLELSAYVRQGLEVVLIGHRGQPEVEGTRRQVPEQVHVLCSVAEVMQLQVANPARLAYVTQTTLSLDDTRTVVAALQQRFPDIRGPALGDICFATQNRQVAVRELAPQVDLLLVIGARNSSNVNRLYELGQQQGVLSRLVERPAEVRPEWLRPGLRIALTAGASTPEVLVQGVIERLRSLHPLHLREGSGCDESTVFPPPTGLAGPSPSD
jgi:4-hydroxy-3-methylbut-2-enyl diphosphate reductase